MLEQFGLTPTEEKVYLALLRLGLSSAADVIKKTQLHRTTVYDVLDRLIEKGLVSFIFQNQIKHYLAAKPSKFLDITLEEKKLAEKKSELAKKVIAEIESIKEEAKTKSLAQIFIGTQGLKTVMEDIIEVGEDFLGFGGTLRFKDVLPIYTEQWAEKRRKKKIRARLIGSVGTKAPLWELNECRAVPKEYLSPASTFIYGDKIAIFVLEEQPPTIILIESEKLARSYRNYFELLWKIAKK